MSRHWIDYAFGGLFLLIPLSVPLDWDEHQINLPSELWIAVLAVWLLFKVDWKRLWDSNFLRQPITLASLAYLTWMGCSLPFSTFPLVSLKYFAVTLAHWWVFYMGSWWYRQQSERPLSHWWQCYIFSFALVLFYAWSIHAQYDFGVAISVMVARPFYADHTLYSTVLSILIFPLLYWSTKQGEIKRWVYWILTLCFLLGICLSFCRAAWLSLVLTAGLGMLVMVFNLRFPALLALLLVLGGITVVAIPRLQPLLVQNTTESKKGGWLEQIQSIGNIRSDVSNLERLNRYSCAWRMFLDRPITGFGTGTFALAYLPYQRPEEMTRLSVNSHRRIDGRHYSGQGGGAHSEYLQALSELGLVGLLSWLLLIGSSWYTALRIYFQHKKQSHRRWAMALFWALNTFYLHSFFNNFLHQEEVSVLFWSMLAALAMFNTATKEPLSLSQTD